MAEGVGECALFVVVTLVLPVVLNKSTERGHFDWLHSHGRLRIAWTAIFCFFSLYLLSKPELFGGAMKLTQSFPGFIGYAIAGFCGATLLCGYWWFAGKAFTTKSNSIHGTSAVASHATSEHHENSVPEKLAPPDIRTRQFATLVPIVPAWTDSPVPMDTSLADPHGDFYQDLLSLAGRPKEQPANWPKYKERNLESDLGSSFAVRMIQYYVFRSIYRFERGSSGTRITIGKGVTPINVEPIPPPDAELYPNERVLSMLSDNEFLRPGDKMLWSINKQLPVPKGTTVAFMDEPAIPEQGKMLICRVRFERPRYYRLDFEVSSSVGANNMMPAGFEPQMVPGVSTWTIIVTMRSEVQKRTDGGFQPDAYSAWANALFEALRKEMAFD